MLLAGQVGGAADGAGQLPCVHLVVTFAHEPVLAGVQVIGFGEFHHDVTHYTPVLVVQVGVQVAADDAGRGGLVIGEALEVAGGQGDEEVVGESSWPSGSSWSLSPASRRRAFSTSRGVSAAEDTREGVGGRGFQRTLEALHEAHGVSFPSGQRLPSRARTHVAAQYRDRWRGRVRDNAGTVTLC
ncbi:MAG: hypothetical protein U1U88_001405 [Lawsonella clevelandensis]